jgi:hypothetical protein
MIEGLSDEIIATSGKAVDSDVDVGSADHDDRQQVLGVFCTQLARHLDTAEGEM